MALRLTTPPPPVFRCRDLLQVIKHEYGNKAYKGYFVTHPQYKVNSDGQRYANRLGLYIAFTSRTPHVLSKMDKALHFKTPHMISHAEQGADGDTKVAFTRKYIQICKSIHACAYVVVFVRIPCPCMHARSSVCLHANFTHACSYTCEARRYHRPSHLISRSNHVPTQSVDSRKQVNATSFIRTLGQAADTSFR